MPLRPQPSIGCSEFQSSSAMLISSHQLQMESVTRLGTSLMRQVGERWVLQRFTMSFSLHLVHLLSFGSLTLTPCSYLAPYGNKANVITPCVERALAHSNHTGQRSRSPQKCLCFIHLKKTGRRGKGDCFIFTQNSCEFL